MPKRTAIIFASAIAGTAAALLSLCFNDLADSGTPARISDFGCYAIPVALAVYSPLFTRRLFARDSYLVAAFVTVPALVAFCLAAFIAAAFIGDIARQAGWGDVLFTFRHGADRPVMRAAPHSVLSGLFMWLFCFVALSALRHSVSRRFKSRHPEGSEAS